MPARGHAGFAGVWVAALMTLANPAQARVETFGLDGRPPQAHDAARIDTARALEQRADWAGLLAHGEDWARVRPDEALAWFVQGRALAALGRFEDAEAAYRRALGLDPTDAPTHNNLGLVLRERGALREALGAFRAAVEQEAGYLPGWENLVLTLNRLYGRLAVLPLLERLRSVEPGLADLALRFVFDYSLTRDPRIIQQALATWQQLAPEIRTRLLDTLLAHE